MLSDNDLIQQALEEDIGSGDITCEAIIPPDHRSVAVLLAKEKGVLAGSQWFTLTFQLLDPEIEIAWNYQEGDSFEEGTTLARLSGSTRTLLTAERTALNIIQHLCGIASRTREMVRMLEGYSIQILDTRKTLPLFRTMEKYAVRIGGGQNHRFGLYDMFLIKENHIAAAGSLSQAVALCRSLDKDKKIEVETTTLDEVREALSTEADIIMLDNMNPRQIEEASGLIRLSGKKTEVSGNITPEKIEQIKKFPIDFISMGSLTHSVKACDLSLLIQMNN